MEIFIDPASDTSLTKQIYEEIRSSVLEGRVGAGDRLPPSRELAETLGVSRHTVTTAYGQLTAEGFLDGRRGGGTVVADLGPRSSGPAVERPAADGGQGKPRMDTTWDLRPGFPDPALFPMSEWKRYAKWAVDAHDVSYGDPAGDLDLRRALARSVGRSRGIDARPEDVVVTSGAQQAFYILLRTVVDAGDTVAMENPGYDQFRDLVTALGANVAAVPVDGDGIIVDEIPADARVVYVTPSHQFPTGVTMSLDRRLKLLDLARERAMLIIEDDYDSEFRYVDRPLEPLYRLDPLGQVAYVGTFSKTLSPGLRLGYAVLPPGLIQLAIDLRSNIDWAPPDVDQRTLRHYIANGAFDRHLRKAKKAYQPRHATVSSFVDEMPQLHSSPSNAGLHIAAYLHPDIEEASLLADLEERGVGVAGFARYSSDPETTPGGVVIGFGQVGGPELDSALGRIAALLPRV